MLNYQDYENDFNKLNITKEEGTDYATLLVKGKLWKNFNYPPSYSASGIYCFKSVFYVSTTSSSYYLKWTEDFSNWSNVTGFSSSLQTFLDCGDFLVLQNSSYKLFVSNDGKTATELTLLEGMSGFNSLSYADGKLWIWNNGANKMYSCADKTTILEEEGWTGGHTVKEAGNVWLTVISNKLYYSEDKGTTWVECLSLGGNSSYLDVYTLNNVMLMQVSVGSGSSSHLGVYRSTDGKTWTVVSSSIIGGGNALCIAFNKFWAFSTETFTGNPTGLFSSTDGETWTQVAEFVGLWNNRQCIIGNDNCMLLQSSQKQYYTEDGETFFSRNFSATNTSYKATMNEDTLVLGTKDYSKNFKNTIVRDNTKDLDFALTPGA